MQTAFYDLEQSHSGIHHLGAPQYLTPVSHSHLSTAS